MPLPLGQAYMTFAGCDVFSTELKFCAESAFNLQSDDQPRLGNMYVIYNNGINLLCRVTVWNMRCPNGTSLDLPAIG